MWTGQADQLAALPRDQEQLDDASAAAADLHGALGIAASASAAAVHADGDRDALAPAAGRFERRSSDPATVLGPTLADAADEATNLPDMQVVEPAPVDTTPLQAARLRAGSISNTEPRVEGGGGARTRPDEVATLAATAQGAVSDPVPKAPDADALSPPALPDTSALGSPAGSAQSDPAGGTLTTNRPPVEDLRSSLSTAGPSADANRLSGAQDSGREARLPAGLVQWEQPPMPAGAAQSATAQRQTATSSPAPAVSTGAALLSAELRRAGYSPNAPAGPRFAGAAVGVGQLEQRAADPDVRGSLRGAADPDQLLQSLVRDAATAFELKPATAGGSGNLQTLSLAPATVTTEATPVSPATLSSASAPTATTAAASVAASPQQLALALGDARELGQELGRLLSRGQLDGQRSLSVTLYPEELGRLDIRVASAGEQGVAVSIQAQLPQVRDLLEAQVGRLRAALGEGGFTEVEVDLGERADERGSSEQRSSEQDVRAHQQASGTNTMPIAQPDDLLTRVSRAGAAASGFNAYA